MYTLLYNVLPYSKYSLQVKLAGLQSNIIQNILNQFEQQDHACCSNNSKAIKTLPQLIN